MSSFPTGWIRPADRTVEQAKAHEDAVNGMPRFSVAKAFTPLPKGTKIDLTERWSHEKVVADIGFPFPRFHQIEGSCVGASLGNAAVSLSCTQRTLPTGATKAAIFYWLFNYGRGRLMGGMRGRGHGSFVSAQAKQAILEGMVVDQGSAMPDFQQADGLVVSSATETQFSDGTYSAQWVNLAKEHPIGTAAPANDVETIYEGIANGFPYHYGCDYFIGHGAIKGSGEKACVMGKYDTYGPHATCFLGVWEHEDFGLLFKYQNNWPKGVYPADPNGKGSPCSLWTPASEVTRMINNMGGKGEGFLYSHLNWFPAQVDELLNWVP